MKNQSYYEVLDIHRTATLDKIKRRYRELVKKFHPDRNPGNKFAEEQFKDIAKAYECLSNKEKRAAYDRMLDELNKSNLQISPTTIINHQTQDWEKILGGVLLFGIAAYALSSLSPLKRKKRLIKRKRKQ